MELKRAKEVLESSGVSVSLDLLKKDSSLYINDKGKVFIYSYSNQGQLEAIATWMRDPEGVVKA